MKQADLVLAMHLRGDAFTPEEKARNFEYYEAITVRDSSLSSSTQAVIAAEVGQMELAYDYLGEAALMDLSDLEHNVRDGVHVGSLAGAWVAVVAGLGGMRHHGGHLSFAPRLPRPIRRLRFRVSFLDRLIEVAVTRREATYRLLKGRSMRFDHHGEELRLGSRTGISLPIPEMRARPAPNASRVLTSRSRTPFRAMSTLMRLRQPTTRISPTAAPLDVETHFLA